MKEKRERGFSIAELLVTLCILAILILMSLYLGKGQVMRADFTGAINQFVADLHYARQLASRENRYVAFDFDATGTSYTILVQRQIGLDLSQAASYSIHKTVEPLEGEQFISAPVDFAMNAMGMIHAYPVNINANLITVNLDFFKKDLNTGDKVYQRRLTLYPSGGIKIEKQ